MSATKIIRGLEQALEHAEKSMGEDIAKLAHIEATYQSGWDDPLVTIFDITSILSAAKHFGVLPIHAYYRAKALGLLSYQSVGTAPALAAADESVK